jgi:hypothetical protein
MPDERRGAGASSARRSTQLVAGQLGRTAAHGGNCGQYARGARVDPDLRLSAFLRAPRSAPLRSPSGLVFRTVDPERSMVHGALSRYVVKKSASKWILSESSAARAQCSRDRGCFYESSALQMQRCTDAFD